MAATGIVVALLGARAVQAQGIDPNMYVPNSTVFSSAVSGNTFYTGGQFTRVGPASGAAVPVDVTTGAPIPGFPRVAVTINAIVADGSGGWYVGGAFLCIISVPRLSLAALDLAIGVVTPWNPGANGAVRSIAVGGDGTVYVGGLPCGGEAYAGCYEYPNRAAH